MCVYVCVFFFLQSIYTFKQHYLIFIYYAIDANKVRANKR